MKTIVTFKAIRKGKVIFLTDSKIDFDRLTYKAKFLYIVEKLYGKKFVESTPVGYAYEFKLIKPFKK